MEEDTQHLYFLEDFHLDLPDGYRHKRFSPELDPESPYIQVYATVIRDNNRFGKPLVGRPIARSPTPIGSASHIVSFIK